MVTGIRIGNIGGGGISIDGDAKPKRAPDLMAGDTAVWLEKRGANIQATVGEFGTTVTLGEGQSSSMSMGINGKQLDLEVDGNRLTVNGHAFNVSVADGVVEAKPAAPKPPTITEARVRESVTKAPLRVDARMDPVDAQALASFTSILDQVAPKAAAAASSALANELKAQPWDKNRIATLTARVATTPLPAAELPAVLASFSWDKGRIEALGVLAGKVSGAVDADAALKTFQWDSDRAKAAPLLASLR